MTSRGKSFISQLRRCPLTRTHQTLDFAALDRYTAIRTFFRKQSSHPSGTPLTSHRSELLLSVSISLGRKPFSRSFHGSLSRYDEVRRDKNSLPTTPGTQIKKDEPPTPDSDPHRYDNYPRFFRRLAMSLPHLHRPTQDDLLKAASGFWSRMRIRYRWIFLRSFRRYNADDISAFLTWVFLSQTLWLFIGT